MASIDLLCIVNEERKKYGLMDYDYHRYRTHCTKKLRNLRKSTGLQQVYNHKTKQLVGKRSVDSMAEGISDNNLKYFLVNLFQVEHAWASSRELKEQIQSILKNAANRSTQQAQQKSEQPNSRPRTGVTRVRHHSNNRLSKAIQLSDRFLALCHSSESLSIRTLAQVHVHRLYMRGLLDFELARWESTLDHFALSCVILQALGNSTDQTDHKKRAIFEESIDELAPMIRYCAYKTGSNAPEIEKFCQERLDQNQMGDKLVEKDWPEIKSLVESSKQIVQQTIELKWIDKVIPIRNPELVDLITSLQKADRVLLSTLKCGTHEPSVSADESRPGNSNKKRKRQEFLQAKNPKMNEKNFISATAAFDQALSTYVNVETHMQALVESNNRALELNSTTQRFDQQSTILAVIHSVVGFRLLSTRVNRDVGLVHKLEKKLLKQESRVNDRIRKNPKNYRQINRLVLASSPHRQPASKVQSHPNQPSSNHTYETNHIKALLIKRRQAKMFPSLLKLFDDILFNLERIKQLKMIEDEHEHYAKIECKVSFFKAYRSLIQSKSYLLVEKFLESYVLQQKSNFYLRQTRMNIEEVEELEDDGIDEPAKEMHDLNEQFMRFERGDLSAICEDVQERLRKQIIDEWWRSDGSKAGEKGVGGQTINSLAQTKLAQLSLGDDDTNGRATGKTTPQVFDLAFNYVTQFDWNRLDPTASHVPSPRSSKIQQTSEAVPPPSSSAATRSTSHIIPASHAQPQDQDPPPSKKSGGLWGFFSRS